MHTNILTTVTRTLGVFLIEYTLINMVILEFEIKRFSFSHLNHDKNQIFQLAYLKQNAVLSAVMTVILSLIFYLESTDNKFS